MCPEVCPLADLAFKHPEPRAHHEDLGRQLRAGAMDDAATRCRRPLLDLGASRDGSRAVGANNDGSRIVPTRARRVAFPGLDAPFLRKTISTFTDFVLDTLRDEGTYTGVRELQGQDMAVRRSAVSVNSRVIFHDFLATAVTLPSRRARRLGVGFDPTRKARRNAKAE